MTEVIGHNLDIYTDIPLVSSGQIRIAITGVNAGKLIYHNGASEVVLDAALLALLASVVNSEGASLIGIEDSAGNTAETDVEGAIAELYAMSDGSKYATGTYTGTQAPGNSITGLGFAPQFVWCMGNDVNGQAARSIFDSSGFFDIASANTGGDITVIQSLDADGFTVGSNNLVNGISGPNNFIYHAWRA